jgi:hypothetical protein
MRSNNALERSVRAWQGCAPGAWKIIAPPAPGRGRLSRPRRLVRFSRGPLNADVRRVMAQLRSVIPISAILMLASCSTLRQIDDPAFVVSHCTQDVRIHGSWSLLTEEPPNARSLRQASRPDATGDLSRPFPGEQERWLVSADGDIILCELGTATGCGRSISYFPVGSEEIDNDRSGLTVCADGE